MLVSIYSSLEDLYHLKGLGLGSGEGMLREAGVWEWAGPRQTQKTQEKEKLESVRADGESFTDGKGGTEGVYDNDPAGELFTIPEGFLPKDAPECGKSSPPETPHTSCQRVPQPHTTGRHQCVWDWERR